MTQPQAELTDEELAVRVAQVRRDAIKGKRRLASSVLAMEVVVFWLAIIVAIVSSGVAAPAALGVGGALAVGCVVIAARITRKWAYVAGSVLQVGAIACGVVVHTMFFIGALFALLWFAALRVGDSAIRVAERFAASVQK
ncbi:MAG TPA: DUF4233 domain-containing protein [Acidothermaceae bacterium]|nr:DUF4233 domain-containing protein [Acidothermaceae bacterium]